MIPLMSDWLNVVENYIRKLQHSHMHVTPLSRPKIMAVSRPKMVQLPILNNSHTHPFCKTTPGNCAMANTK